MYVVLYLLVLCNCRGTRPGYPNGSNKFPATTTTKTNSNCQDTVSKTTTAEASTVDSAVSETTTAEASAVDTAVSETTTAEASTVDRAISETTTAEASTVDTAVSETTTAEASTEAADAMIASTESTNSDAITAELSKVQDTTTEASAIEATTIGTNCLMTVSTMTSVIGVPKSEACSSMKGNIISCSIQCSSFPLCKLFFVQNCDPSGKCTCIYCNAMSAMFSHSTFRFYLNTKELRGTNSHRVDLPGGLVIGQPVMVKVALESPVTALMFESSTAEEAFEAKFDFYSDKLFTNWKENSQWGTRNHSTPHFDFTDGQEISVFYIVTSAELKLYIDTVLFRTVAHGNQIANFARFVVNSDNAGATIISLQR
ncbi:hypothetical protein RRG08_005513 [Elysia crispata]|uniref:Galectin n=1 Tax=Elysia crispata TaxID=231223 RepID=A0AAE1CKJ7_9GAST|nr:hypothetical protein RRG08_005513 [Elysia crispata]